MNAECDNQLFTPKISELWHNHTLQTNPLHPEEEIQNWQPILK